MRMSEGQKIQNHKDYDFQYVSYNEAIDTGLKTVSLDALKSNGHCATESDVVVMTEDFFIDINKDYFLLIRKGFATDWASIPKRPRFVRKMLKHNSQDTRRASVVHDALYNQQSDYISWEEANAIFGRMLIEDGATNFKSRVMTWAVGTKIGYKHWVNDTLFDIENRAFSTVLSKKAGMPKEGWL